MQNHKSGSKSFFRNLSFLHSGFTATTLSFIWAVTAEQGHEVTVGHAADVFALLISVNNSVFNTLALQLQEDSEEKNTDIHFTEMIVRKRIDPFGTL